MLSVGASARARALAPHTSSSRSVAACRQAARRRWCERRITDIATSAVAIAPAAVAAEESVEVLRSTKHDAGLRVEVRKFSRAGARGADEQRFQVDVYAEPPRPMLLHWAVGGWEAPPRSIWPPQSRQEGSAVQTPFGGNGHVQLSFPDTECPERVVFVLKEENGGDNGGPRWVNDGGTDFVVMLRPPGLHTVLDKVLTAEAEWSNYSLFTRLCLCLEVLDGADAAGPEGMAFVYTWLRMSHLKLLTWHRNCNYQSKDIAHVQRTMAQRMAAKARGSKDPECRMLARLAMAGLPRGGGNGDDIRMQILHIMRGHGIKEGHRPGLEERFLEQWHQKLHTNTTPDDVAICEAYLAFLHSGNMDDYWRVLWDVGRLSRESLAKFDQPITATPLHLPYLIDAFKGYRWTLKVTHSGADLDTTAVMASGFMDEDLKYQVNDLLAHRNEWWVPGKVVEIRSRLAHYWKAPDASRDLLLLDVALDNWYRICMERIDKHALKGDDLMDLISLTLRNELTAVDSHDLQLALAQWHWVQGGAGGGEEAHRWSKPWAMQALAALQRVELSLAAYMDRFYTMVQKHAETFGERCKVDPKYITTFGEEAVRGQSLFCLSPLLQCLEPMLRNAAGVAPWQVVSTGASAAAVGVVVPVDTLAEVQGQVYEVPTVLLVEKMGGNEDIPPNVQAVLTRSATDVLSHAAIRARAQRVLLATCFDESAWDALQGMASAGAGQVPFAFTITPEGHVVGDLAPESHDATAAAASNGAGGSQVQLQQPQGTQHWVLDEADFAPGLVGAKSLNCSKLSGYRTAGTLPADVQVPHSLALPLGTFERALQDPLNAQVAASLQEQLALLNAGSDTEASAQFQVLEGLRSLVATQLQAPDALRQELAARAAAAGMISNASVWEEGTEAWQSAWAAICQVWGSKWNDRAWLGRRAAGVPDEQLFMGVLLQQVVPADYAFVLHTAHPLTGASGHVVGEVVAGMGETLVGNHPGRALSFAVEPASNDDTPPAPGGVTISSLPSKRTSLRCSSALETPLLIARSDANGEDLEGMAGAGLYDSVPLVPLEERHVDAVNEPLVTQPAFRAEMLARLVDLSLNVRQAFGGVEQDVEGVFSGGHLWVVQSRPQILQATT